MIPSSQEKIDKSKEIAERNIARGDWGEEIMLPWDQNLKTLKEREAETLLGRVGGVKLDKSK